MKPIGILGGGQLARMLILEAHRLNLPVACLSPNSTDPAVSVTSNWFQGDPNRSGDLTSFMSRCSSVTFESEFYDAEVISEASVKSKVSVFPDPKTMGLLQDRLSQKSLFDRYELPTSPWRPVDSDQDAVVAYTALNRRVVFKKRRGGYDGYGTFVVRNENQLGQFAIDHLKEPFIAEKFVRFSREVAVIAVRDQKGTVFFYPYVESLQKDSRCLWVKGPLKETRELSEIKKRIAAFLKGIDYVGAMGIELFDTADGFLVNEIAPRVHNTGHYTMDAFTLSQFALHLRAVAGLEIGGKKFSAPEPLAKGFAMWNLLGTRGSSTLTPWKNTSFNASERLHWYSKIESRPGRKMGHVNATDTTPDRAWLKAKRFVEKSKKEIGF